jgi:hypothetical protein
MSKQSQGFSRKVILSFEDFASFPTDGNSNNFYFDKETGFMYYYDGTNYIKWGGDAAEPFEVIQEVQPTPSLTDPSLNLIRNAHFKDANGDTWVVDINGKALKAGSSNVIFKELNQWHVDKNGSDATGTGADENPFLTIQKAVDAMGQGDIVIVNEGVYNEDVVMSLQNTSITGANGTYGSLVQIQKITVQTASGTSNRISNLKVNELSHTGGASLFLTGVEVATELSKTSSAYLEMNGGSLQGTAVNSITAGNNVSRNKWIKDLQVSGVNTVISLIDSKVDVNATIDIGNKSIYHLQNTGGNIEIDAGAIPLETALIAQGVTAEMAKDYVTSYSDKLGMINPDISTTNREAVFWNNVTKRLEVSPAFAPANTIYIDTEDPADATIFSIEIDPFINDDNLKEDSNNIYIGIDGKVWTWNGSEYISYSTPIATEWYVSGTLEDAGSNKVGAIYRKGNIGYANFDNFIPLYPLDVTTRGQVNATVYVSVDGVNNGNQVVVNLGTKRGTGTFGNGTNKGWQIGARSDSWNQGGTQEANLMFLSFWNGLAYTQLAKFAPNGNVCLGASAYNFIPQFTLDVQGTARILTTPTITTATRMLVKNPTTGQISEQNIPTNSGNGSVESGQTDEFIATANQTTFTLTATPKGDVFAFRNGARLPKNAFTISVTTATYVLANNDGNNFLAGNRITFDYIK